VGNRVAEALYLSEDRDRAHPINAFCEITYGT